MGFGCALTSMMMKMASSEEKKMVLILLGFPYHHSRSADRPREANSRIFMETYDRHLRAVNMCHQFYTNCFYTECKPGGQRCSCLSPHPVNGVTHIKISSVCCQEYRRPKYHKNVHPLDESTCRNRLLSLHLWVLRVM